MNFRNCKNKNYHGLWGGPTKKQPNFQPDHPQEIRARTDKRISALTPPPTPQMTMFPASHMVILKILLIKMTLPYNFAFINFLDLFDKNLTFFCEPNFSCITMNNVQIPFGVPYNAALIMPIKFHHSLDWDTKKHVNWIGKLGVCQMRAKGCQILCT